MRAILRFLGFLATVGGFVALVIDMTRYLANGHWRFCTLADALAAFSPDAGAALAGAAARLAGAPAAAAAEVLLAFPAAPAGFAAGLLLMAVFRKRPPPPF